MRSERLSLVLVFVAVLASGAACDSSSSNPAGTDTAADAGPAGDAAAPADAAGEPDGGGPATDATAPRPDVPAATDTGGGGPDVAAGPAVPAAYSGGECPALVAGTNTITSDGRDRGVELYLPDAPVDAPVVFLWHGVGDSATNIAGYFRATITARDEGAIVVAPHDCCAEGHQDCCNQVAVWGFMGGARRLVADLTLFDDLMYCLSQQYDIDPRRVYTVGFSAGGLWSTYLALYRSEYFAAAAILSGGVGEYIAYQTPTHRLPLLLAWGGEDDIYMNGFVKFYEMMEALVAAATGDDLFFIACDHGLGHTVPYGAPNWIYRFLWDHPWNDQPSPYLTDGLPVDFPDYCGMQGTP